MLTFLKNLVAWISYDDMQESNIKAFFSELNMNAMAQRSSGLIVDKLINAALYWGCDRIEILLKPGILKFSANIDYYPRRSWVLYNPVKCLTNSVAVEDYGENELHKALFRAFSFHPLRVFVSQGQTKRHGRTSRGLDFRFDTKEILQARACGTGRTWFYFNIEGAPNLDISKEKLYIQTTPYPPTVAVYLDDELLLGPSEKS